MPSAWQYAVLAGCCRFAAQKRDGNTPANEPVYVVGSLRSATGIGEGARLYALNLLAQGKEVVGVDVTDAMLQRSVLDAPSAYPVIGLHELAECDGAGTVIIHANPPLFQLLLLRLKRNFLRNKRLVAYWAWELENLPASYIDALPYIDAVEVPSEFTAHSVRQATNKHVTVVPHKLAQPEQRKASYAEHGILRCLFLFDLASGCERKNPWAAIAAFAEAFPDGQGASLTLKASQVKAATPATRKRLRSLVDTTPGVRLLTDDLSAAELNALYLEHDVYLSLHRSEGFGLTLLEAMQRGLHVVATDWSGNTDFMYGPLAHPVPYTLALVTDASMPRCAQPVHWAEADMHAAAAILRELRNKLC